MVWLTDPVVALEALIDVPQLHARPTVLSAPVLRVCIGALPEGIGPQHGTAACKSFHEEFQVACLDACSPHVTALIPVGGQQAVGTKGCAIDLQFGDASAARLKRQAICDDGTMHLQTSHGPVHVPVRSQPGRIPSSCAQVRVHGLPAEFRRQGLISALLACAGYADSALVQAEFGGELPASIAACHPQVEWYTHPTMPTMAFRVQHSAPGLLVHAFSVGISFALTPLDSVPRMHSSQLVPAHVLDWDPRRAYRSPPVDSDAQAPQLTHYLTQHLGSCFSPQLWSIGDRSLPAFVVKEACERRVQLRCIASDSSFVPSQPLRPAIWEDDWAADGVPALGIRAREARWVQGVGRAPALVRNTRDWEPEPAAWQRQSRPRPLPPRRVFDASVAAAPARLAVDALQDPLGSDSSTSAPPWSPVWRRLLGIELDRQHRALAWRILHGSVLCGAFRTYVGRGTAEQAPCPHAACMGSLQTLSHMFVTCSVAAPVWSWVASLMACLPDCTRPPITVSVLLADDSRVWHPPSKLQPLWLRLRLATLHALWCEGAKVRRGGPAGSARGVACRVLAYCRKLMVQHWSRVGMHRRDLGGCPQWLMSRDPHLSVDAFGDWWSAGGVLCEIVHAGHRPHIDIKWDAQHPVPIPP